MFAVLGRRAWWFAEATKDEERSIEWETGTFSGKLGFGWIRLALAANAGWPRLADVRTLAVHCRISTGRSVGNVKPAQEPGPRRRCHGQASLSGARQGKPCHHCRGPRGWRSRSVRKFNCKIPLG